MESAMSKSSPPKREQPPWLVRLLNIRVDKSGKPPATIDLGEVNEIGEGQRRGGLTSCFFLLLISPNFKSSRLFNQVRLLFS